MLAGTNATTENMSSIPGKPPSRPGSPMSATRSRASGAGRPARALPILTPRARKSRTPPRWSASESLAIPPAYADVWICPEPTAISRPPARDAQGAASNTATIRAFREVRDEHEVRAHAGLRAAPAGDRASIDERHAPARPAAREGARDRRASARDHAHPRRQRRYAKQNKSYGLTTLRDPHVKVDGARAAVPVQGQERQDLEAAGRRTGASPRSSRPARTCRGRTCSSISTRTASAQIVTSADVNAYLSEITGARHHRQGFPHLGRHRAGGHGAAGVRAVRQRGQGQEEHPRGHRAGRRAPRQHADDLPQMLRPPGGLRLPTSTASCSSRIKQEVETELREDLASKPGGGRRADPAQEAPVPRGREAGGEEPAKKRRASRGRTQAEAELRARNPIARSSRTAQPEPGSCTGYGGECSFGGGCRSHATRSGLRCATPHDSSV